MTSLAHILEKDNRVQSKWAIIDFFKKLNMAQTK